MTAKLDELNKKRYKDRQTTPKKQIIMMFINKKNVKMI